MARPAAHDGSPPGVTIFAPLAERVRESAAWLVASFGAVALLLVPGLQLADLGALDGARLALSIATALAAALALGIAVALIAPFLRSNATTLVDLACSSKPRKQAVIRALNENRTLFQGEAVSVQELLSRDKQARYDLRRAEEGLPLATKALADAQARLASAPFAERRCFQLECAKARADRDRAVERIKGARARLSVLAHAFASVEAVARFVEIEIAFRSVKKWLVVCTVVVACAMAGLAIASHPPSPGVTNFSHAHLTDVGLGGTDLREATFAHASLVRVDLTDANLHDANFEDVTWRAVTCPDGGDSDDVGATCEGHLTPAAATRASR